MSVSSVEGQYVVLRWGQCFVFLECGQNPALKRYYSDCSMLNQPLRSRLLRAVARPQRRVCCALRALL